MKSHTSLQCFLTVFILWFVNMGYNAQIMRLSEGEICLKGSNSSSNYICKNINNCPHVANQRNGKSYIVKVCSYRGKNKIVCCPPTPEPTETNPTTKNPIAAAVPPTTLIPNGTYSATEMCSKYSKLINIEIRNPTSLYGKLMSIQDCYRDVGTIVNGTDTHPKEFPHMALLGYNETPDQTWKCGGSLISERFVLTAAHCERMNDGYSLKYATWARLGDLDYLSNTEDANPQDYKIELRIIHPQYKNTSHYHDIALFRLERDVEFSPFARPICLNTNNSLYPPKFIATGWGVTGNGENFSSRLLKTELKSIPIGKCNEDFSTQKNINVKQKLSNGIINDLMICSGVQDGKDTCEGDSGSPIQISHSPCMYTQIGITSFGKYCGLENESGVYTRVSHYIPWIEKIVWPIQN